MAIPHPVCFIHLTRDPSPNPSPCIHPGINETGSSADELEGDAATLEVHLDDTDTDMLVDFEDIGGTGDPAAASVRTGGTHT